MINPEWLRTFLTLAEVRHFTKASRALHMTQPGVSQHLKKVEEYFGVPLVHRQGKSFTVTDAGKRVVQYASGLFAEHRRFQESLSEDEPHAGRCRFACPGSFGFKVFDTLLAEAVKHRGLNVELMVAPNAQIVGLLREERVDVGFMSEETRDPFVEAERFAREKLLLVLPRRVRDKSLRSLLELGYVNHPDGFHYAQRLLSRNYPQFSGTEALPISVFINQINRILDAVAAALGFAILPETACRRYPNPAAIRVVELRYAVEDPIYKVVRRRERLPRRYGELLQRLSL